MSPSERKHRKRLCGILPWFAVVMGVAFAVGTYADAATRLATVAAQVNQALRLVVNGQVWQPQDPEGTPLAPLTYQGRTYIPVKALENEAFRFGDLSFRVDWDAAAQTVSITSSGGQAAAPELRQLEERRVDLTGDGIPETVRLYGYQSSPDAFRTDAFALFVADGDAPVVRVLPTDEGGFEPRLTFADFTGDGVAELMFSAPTGGNRGMTSTHLYTYRDENYVALPLPTATVTARLEDGLQAVIEVPEIGESFAVDIREKQDEYEERGIYKGGKVIEEIDLLVLPITRYERTPSEGASDLLAGFLDIAGLYHADGIADVILTWRWENGDWVLQKAQVLKQAE